MIDGNVHRVLASMSSHLDYQQLANVAYADSPDFFGNRRQD